MSAHDRFPSSSGSGSVGSTALATGSSGSTSSSESVSENDEVVKFGQKFRTPKHSELMQKRVIRHTLYKKKPSCTSDPKSVTPMQRVQEFLKNSHSQLVSSSVTCAGRNCH